ncbi:AAA family ATPase [Vibrio parahaemolyticus]|nr:AAA family ATPase [Vibrio parahaemolyticus]EJC6781049.1 AAA family ATPase [Vibrio parahaemolyticus]EJC6809395.1 AAA family ATPase [Vibrio parahaemolyticus]EJC6923926.1 AAA family ATPase [Vibrio parahaemolyticus]EJC6970606.1 AAA family ATPase [Vibrio parahaemolyticus]
MELSANQLHIDKIEVLNLAGKESITIPFRNQVTFLTGINGCGKSSLLNVLFDSLAIVPAVMQRPALSKFRFWASRVHFNNGECVDTLVMPNPNEKDKDLSDRVEAVIGKEFFDLKKIRAAQELYTVTEEDHSSTFISFDNNPEGEWWKKSFEEGAIKEFCEKRPLAFIYQEDRQTLHNLDNYSIERNSFYWLNYSNSIDERFAYCRSALQVRESTLNKRVVKEIVRLQHETEFASRILESKEYIRARSKLKEIEDIYEKLDKYLVKSNKKIVKDEYDKITLAIADDENETPISWHLLSRGEKTLMYLFLTTYYYKDRVAVFLLDEPEIALHVDWQSDLIKDLVDIAPGNQFIIATHSPSLVMNGWIPNCLDLSKV